MNKLKGFTVIELIVVIAIISVLATIVTSNVYIYVNKSKNTAIVRDMSNLLMYGLTYYSGNGNYDFFCGSPETINFINGINNLAGPDATLCNCNIANCASTSTAWCMVVPEVNVTSSMGVHKMYYCVDSSGKKVECWSQVRPTCSNGICPIRDNWDICQNQ
jgi:prepilin-type N-terminal cleavage/methylation domain-containing protein